MFIQLNAESFFYCKLRPIKIDINLKWNNVILKSHRIEVKKKKLPKKLARRLLQILKRNFFFSHSQALQKTIANYIVFVLMCAICVSVYPFFDDLLKISWILFFFIFISHAYLYRFLVRANSIFFLYSAIAEWRQTDNNYLINDIIIHKIPLDLKI